MNLFEFNQDYFTQNQKINYDEELDVVNEVLIQVDPPMEIPSKSAKKSPNTHAHHGKKSHRWIAHLFRRILSRERERKSEENAMGEHLVGKKIPTKKRERQGQREKADEETPSSTPWQEVIDGSTPIEGHRTKVVDKTKKTVEAEILWRRNHFFFADDTTLFAKDRKGKTREIVLSTKTKRAEGGTAAIYSVNTVALELFSQKETMSCLKEPKISSNNPLFEPNLVDFQNEVRTLYALRDVRGIVSPPWLVLPISSTTEEGVQLPGYLTKFYRDGSLDSWLERHALFMEEKKAICHQLMQTFLELKQRGILHGDIKPANILCKKKEGVPLQVYIADFGGALFYHELDESSMRRFPTTTQRYYCSQDISAIHEAGRNDLLPLEERRQLYRSIGDSADTFALAVTLYQILSTHRGMPLVDPFPANDVGEIDLSSPLDEANLRNEHCPDPIIELLRQMTDPEWQKRPSPDQLGQFLHHFTQEEGVLETKTA